MDEIKARIAAFASSHTGAVILGAAGAFTAVLILCFGFWSIAFVYFCTGIGAYAGHRIDDRARNDDSRHLIDDFTDNILDRFNNLRP